MTDTVEQGGIYFLYRNRVDVAKVRSLDDVQRLYVVLAPDGERRARLLIVGAKRLPDIEDGRSGPTGRYWAVVSMVEPPRRIGEVMHPLRYDTATRGERIQGEAIPAGEGRYAIVERDGETSLSYRLHAPQDPGEAQRALGIRSAATYVLAVRNPGVQVPGFPEEGPDYPASLREAFAEERWLGVTDPRLLDYENAQLVLIGAFADVPDEVDLDGEPALLETLGLDASRWPTGSLREGDFVQPRREVEPIESGTDRSKGGRRGGRAAAETDSAAGVAKALKGISFPCRRADLVRHAERGDAAPEIVELLEALPDRRFETMADVAKAVGEVR